MSRRRLCRATRAKAGFDRPAFPPADVEGSSLRPLAKLPRSHAHASQADLRDLIDRVTIGRTTIQVQLSEAVEAEAGARTADTSVDAAVALSEA